MPQDLRFMSPTALVEALIVGIQVQNTRLLIHLKSHLLMNISLRQFQTQEFHIRILRLLQNAPAL